LLGDEKDWRISGAQSWALVYEFGRLNLALRFAFRARLAPTFLALVVKLPS
jgi:hypothetical protein